MSTASRFLRIIPYVIIVAVVYASAFLTFEFLFKSTHGGTYYQNVVVALLGTILTVVITSILLAEQSRSEEVKERHVEVFSKMVDRYERMTSLLLRSEEQGQLDEAARREICEAFYDMSLFCSPRSLDTTASFLQQQLEAGSAGDRQRVSLFEVISRFREDMGLPLGADKEAILSRVERTILQHRCGPDAQPQA
jgi:hypothetical protein